MKNLPIGIQTFQKIRDKKENYIYIDKTDLALKLINSSGYYFLSRPRRFGKSLFLDTLKDIFEGKKELFKGLYIYDKWDWETTYPVIKISFGLGVVKSVENLDMRILSIIKENQKRLDVECENIEDSSGCLRELIISAYEKYNQKVVILIDEYDKPILDNINDKELSTEIRDGLKNIYSVIKDSDQYVKFAFLTGVSKFSKVSLFSGLNNLEDISLDARYATVCGYTHNDVKETFIERLEGVDLDELKKWYNGYNFLGEGVYNPFDILLFFSKGKIYSHYWFETGSPSFLIQVLKEQKYFLPNLENIYMSETDLGSFDINDIKIETLLFQTGYLTIQEVNTRFNQRVFKLSYPNLEVRTALNERIFRYLLTDNILPKNAMFDAIEFKDMKQFEKALYQLFASIPYNSYVNNDIQNYEGYYANVIYSYLSGLGIQFIAEDVTNLGRVDLTIATPDMSQVYIIEFKVVDSKNQKGNALQQIKDKRYHEKYKEKANEIIIIGIEFFKEEKNICKFEWEKI
ncbi:ATP-binding protein [bacterium]|nr:ATP-binding protein [bacterium]MBU1958332.1 ATP-binding protein [bacterium]